jgi:hypothetical protein
MATPAWLAATATQPGQSGQVNQFLGTHAASIIYTGATIASQTTTGSGNSNTNATWLAQSFATGVGVSAVGRVRLMLGFTGSPTPLTVSLYANSAGAPTGSPLVSTFVPTNYLTGGGSTVSIPLPVSVSASTTYWIVLPAVGDASDFYQWFKSNQTSGASTSTNGTSWTAQTYGFLYTTIDQTPTFPLVHTWEDSGARWTTVTSNANGTPSQLQELTTAQGTNQYMYSSRSFTYSSSIPPALISAA